MLARSRHRELERFFELSSDLLVIADQHVMIRVNPAFQRTIGYSPRVPTIPFELIPPEDREAVRTAIEAVPRRHGPVRFESRALCRDGVRRWFEWIVVPQQGFFFAFGRDVSERRREQEQLRRLATQQAALRRVATLVASGVSPEEVVGAVAEEMGRCLDVQHAEVFRYEDDGAAIGVAACYAETGSQGPRVGERLTLEGDNVAATVFRSRRPSRMDSLENAAGSLAARMRELGMHSRVGAPIIVDERLWGLALVGSPRPGPLPPDTEQRIAEFADLVATAIAASTTRAELVASRARIVAAADDARRRIERDLHDGAQQRLVSLALKLRMAQESVPAELTDVRTELSEAVSGLSDVCTELQELSRGIHPSILAKGGLRPALQNLARRSAVPVTLDVVVDRRLPQPAEVAAYYVVAEALTNADKHARASVVNVAAYLDDTNLCLSIGDDGSGGADAGRGSGLIGLKDRVEALSGELKVESRAGNGTSLHVTIPVDAGPAPTDAVSSSG
ncbi:MAG: GAF domain-containing protein [Mycobacterium sp.]